MRKTPLSSTAIFSERFLIKSTVITAIPNEGTSDKTSFYIFHVIIILCFRNPDFYGERRERKLQFPFGGDYEEVAV